MDLNKRIEFALKESGTSRKDVAKKCGVSVTAVGQWIRGESNAPTAVNMLGVADITGFNLKWLIAGKGPKRAAHLDEKELSEAVLQIREIALALEDTDADAILSILKKLAPSADTADS